MTSLPSSNTQQRSQAGSSRSTQAWGPWSRLGLPSRARAGEAREQILFGVSSPRTHGAEGHGTPPGPTPQPFPHGCGALVPVIRRLRVTCPHPRTPQLPGPSSAPQAQLCPSGSAQKVNTRGRERDGGEQLTLGPPTLSR